MSFRDAIPFESDINGRYDFRYDDRFDERYDTNCNSVDEKYIFNYQNLESFIYSFIKRKFKNIDEDSVLQELQYFCAYYLISKRQQIYDFDISKTEIVSDLWLKFKTQLLTCKFNIKIRRNSTYILFTNMNSPSFISELVMNIRDYFFNRNFILDENLDDNITTENNALSYPEPRTLDGIFVTAFFKFMRGLEQDKVFEILDRCWTSNIYQTGRLIFQTRDIREGKGERKLFCQCMTWIAVKHTSYFKSLVNLFLEYGRGDDIFVVLGMIYDLGENELFLELNNYVNTWVDIVIRNDDYKMNNFEAVSLMAKWFPSENSSLNRKYSFYDRFCLQLGYTPRQLRKKYIAPLRRYINIVETILSGKQYHKLNKEYLSTIPSKAMHKLKKALERHSPEWNSYINALRKGSNGIKINTGALFPHEIISGLIENSDWNEYNLNNYELIRSQWKQMLSDLREKMENSGINFRKTLALCDTSGSMYGIPMNVSIALGLIISGLTNDEFKNLIVTFESDPHFINIPNAEEDIIKAISFMCDINRFPWGGSTNFSAVFTKLLDYAVNYKYPPGHKKYANKVGLAQEDMVERIFVFSDMQFDEADDGNFHTNYENICNQFEWAGYQVPEIVFWNLRGNTSDFPVKPDENGVCLVSGYSPTLMKNVMDGGDFNPVNIVYNTLNNERYDAVEKNMRCVDEVNFIRL